MCEEGGREGGWKRGGAARGSGESVERKKQTGGRGSKLAVELRLRTVGCRGKEDMGFNCDTGAGEAGWCGGG